MITLSHTTCYVRNAADHVRNAQIRFGVVRPKRGRYAHGPSKNIRNVSTYSTAACTKRPAPV